MTAEVFQANYDELAMVKTNFHSQSEKGRSLLSSLSRHFYDLEEGGWAGAGANAFFSEMHRDILPSIVRLINALDEAGTTTSKISIVIQEAEKDAAAIWGGEAVSGPIIHDSPNIDSTLVDQPSEIGMIPPLDYALMSKGAYEATLDGQLPQSLRDKGWARLDTFQTDSGYYGVALINHQTQEVVFAHRGTDMDIGDGIEVFAPMAGKLASYFGLGVNLDGSDLDDDAVLALGGVPEQFYASRRFIDQIERQMTSRGLEGYQITHTGHSLGGFLADMHAAENDHLSITFDNPGAKESIDNAGFRYNPGNHLAYQSHPNLINQVKTQAGLHMHIKLKSDTYWGVLGGVPGAAADLAHDHSIDNIVDAIDPNSGFPYRI